MIVSFGGVGGVLLHFVFECLDSLAPFLQEERVRAIIGQKLINFGLCWVIPLQCANLAGNFVVAGSCHLEIPIFQRVFAFVEELHQTPPQIDKDVFHWLHSVGVFYLGNFGNEGNPAFFAFVAGKFIGVRNVDASRTVLAFFLAVDDCLVSRLA